MFKKFQKFERSDLYARSIPPFIRLDAILTDAVTNFHHIITSPEICAEENSLTKILKEPVETVAAPKSKNGYR